MDSQTSTNVGPRPSSLVRLGGIACGLLVAGGLAFAAGWWPLGVVLCVLAAAMVVACALIGELCVRVALRAHANVFALLAKGSGGAHRASSETPEQRDERRRVDAQVGFLLGAGESPMDAALPDGERTAMLAARRAERAATYAWLESIPAPRSVRIAAEDGAELAALEFACTPESSRWVVLAHGYGGCGREMMLYARHWAELGFNLLVPDMRGHGESAGRFVGMGWLDRRDLVTWVRWLVRERGEGVRVVLHGHSMGGASVCLAAGEADLPGQVRAVVSDCAFANAWGSLAGVCEQAGLPEHPTLDLADVVLRCHRGGYALERADARAGVGHARVLMLFVHGARDALVPPTDAARLHDACKSESELLVVEGAGHCESCLANPDVYWSAVRRLLARAGVL